MEPTIPERARPPGLGELLRTALLMGAIGFGGGLSVLGLIESFAVRRKRWLSERDWAATATIAQMLPGGAATNALTAIGLRFGGLRGAAVTCLGFIAPGAVLVFLLAMLYVRFGTVPGASAFLAGLNASVVGIILAIAVRMSRTSIARLWQMGIAAGALVLSLVGNAGSGEVALLGAGAGVLWDLGLRRAQLLRRRRVAPRPSPPVALPEEGSPLRRTEPQPAPEPTGPGSDNTTACVAFGVLAVAAPVIVQALGDVAAMAVVFLRTGLGAYGGGFAIITSLHADVMSHQWLSEQQFADAVAVGKLTPGPVLLMATFVGYLKAGVPGALVATVSIFAAPFLLVVVLTTWLERVRSTSWMRAALRGLTPSVVGLMIAAALTLGSSLRNVVGVAIAAVVALTLIRFHRVNPAVLLMLGGAARVIYRLATGT